jgi:EAL domain-containing protein (putative c-di-GMP-specific phosphodiesterase class I)
VGLGPDLEFAALQAALKAAQQLPSHLYVDLNLSPAACLDPRLRAFLEQSRLSIDRIVIELTERLAEEEYGPIVSALAPLRSRGLRVAVDGAGAGFASMRQVRQLSPDIVKLDRSLIAGIDHVEGQQTLGAAMVELSRQINADLVAEGIETEAELATVTKLGMTAGQGYLLGRPSVQPLDWASWGADAEQETFVSESANQST